MDDEVADGASPVDYSVQSTVVHENYIEWKFENDIALVKLRSLVQFTREKIKAFIQIDSKFSQESNYI